MGTMWRLRGCRSYACALKTTWRLSVCSLKYAYFWRRKCKRRHSYIISIHRTLMCINKFSKLQKFVISITIILIAFVICKFQAFWFCLNTCGHWWQNWKKAVAIITFSRRRRGSTALSSRTKSGNFSQFVVVVVQSAVHHSFWCFYYFVHLFFYQSFSQTKLEQPLSGKSFG